MNINQEIFIPITPTVEGIKRIVKFEGFNFWYHTRKIAEMSCSIWMVNNDNQPIKNLDLNQGRAIRIEISNNNRVTEQGITIAPNSIDWQNGIPEYDFYFSAFMLQANGTPLDVILGSMQLMAQLKDENNLTRFDRP